MPNNKEGFILTNAQIEQLSEFYKTFGDETRLKILFAIKREGLCVQHIAKVVGISQSGVSHQLKYLKNANIVKSEKSGKKSIYSIDDDHIYKILKQGCEHLSHTK